MRSVFRQALAVSSFVLLFGVVREAVADNCIEVGRISAQVDHLFSSPLDPDRSSYLIYREGSVIHVAKLTRPPETWDVTIEHLYTLPSIAGAKVSTAIAGNTLIVSHQVGGQSSAQQFYAPSEYRKVSKYNLLNGQALTPSGGTALPFTQNVSGGWPRFYPDPVWSYSNWKPGFCAAQGEGPLGYLVSGRNDGTFIAANFVQYFTNLEQRYLAHGENFCSPPPYKRNPDGSILYAQDIVLDSQGNHFCDPIHSEPTYSCSAFTEGGQLIINNGVRGCRISGGTPPPDAECIVRLTPPYPVKFTSEEASSRWGMMNPGARIMSAGSLGLQASLTLPTSLPGVEVPMSQLKVTSMHQPATHPEKGHIALAVGLEAPDVGETGGVFLFNPAGQFSGFVSTFSPGVRQGADGALAAVGFSTFHNASLFAIGAPEDSPSQVYPDIEQPSFVQIVTSSGERLGEFYADALDDGLGTALSVVNPDADGTLDVIAGAPRAVREDMDGSGYIMIHSVGVDGGEELFTMYAPPGEQEFGRLVAGVAADSHGSPFVAAVATSDDVVLYDTTGCLTSEEIVFTQFLAQAMLRTLEEGIEELHSAARKASAKPVTLDSDAKNALQWLLNFTADTNRNRTRNRVLATGTVAAYEAASQHFSVVAGSFDARQRALSKAASKVIKARKEVKKARRGGNVQDALQKQKKAQRLHAKKLSAVNAHSLPTLQAIELLRTQLQSL